MGASDPFRSRLFVQRRERCRFDAGSSIAVHRSLGCTVSNSIGIADGILGALGIAFGFGFRLAVVGIA
ncbi:hypothetical protein [Cohnella candidum]|uniref:hypothetical protein n=1 Tax=Cohnella candidum TaxID=2674991 RepID=UPI0013DDAD25|nr:hypothetical protein [Cohnella candidum]